MWTNSRDDTGRDGMNGRERFKGFLNGEPLTRPAFVPLIRGLLARVEGVSMETLTSDPTLWANSLLKTTELFGFDGIVTGLDFTLMAEACGCEITWQDDRPTAQPLQGSLCEKPEERGRMKHALESTGRIFDTCRSDVACVAALTGPVTLANQLFGEQEGPERTGEMKPAMVRVVEALCATRPDALLFLEDRPPASGAPTSGHRRVYNTLKNIVSHYDVSPGLYLQGYRPQEASVFSGLNMDIYIMGPAADGSLPSLPALWELGEGAVGVGVGVPVDDLDIAREVIREGQGLQRDRAGQGFFLTSAGPVTRDANLETLRSLTEEVLRL
jgi:hypothetical protein